MKHQQNNTDPTATDLDILFPERHITVEGKPLIVREYSFKESLQLDAMLQPLISALSQKINVEQAHLPLEEAISILTKEVDRLIQLIAISTNSEPDFIERLGQREGRELLMLWWTINAPFLWPAAVLHAQLTARKLSKTAAIGDTSLPV